MGLRALNVLPLSRAVLHMPTATCEHDTPSLVANGTASGWPSWTAGLFGSLNGECFAREVHGLD